MAKIKNLEAAQAYLIMRGIEESLVSNLDKHFELSNRVEEDGLLSADHMSKAKKNLEDDYEELGGNVVRSLEYRDLVAYLDVGSLLQVLQSQKKNVDSDLYVKEVDLLTELVTKFGLIKIRNRIMHPGRPLHPDDVNDIEKLASKLVQLNASLDWDKLIEALEEASTRTPDNYLITQIPDYFIEESRIPNNLPVSDFSDTGFIGRKKEIGNLLKILRRSKVVSVTGEGGTGKTALAMKVCYDILDQNTPEQDYDQIHFWSLKTQTLTRFGIKQIRDDIEIDDFVDDLVPGLLKPEQNQESEPWAEIIEAMKKRKILLVIDNLETIGQEIRELLVNVPDGSRILMTTRIGFGEIEERYQIPQMSLNDSQTLFRRIVNVHNYENLKNISNNVVRDYCEKLSLNPLLIRWFVQSVGTGDNPNTILNMGVNGEWTSENFTNALNYCWENVYDRLSPESKQVVAILLASRVTLSRIQLQDLANINQVKYDEILKELDRCSIVDNKIDSQREEQINIKEGVIGNWLKLNHPPADDVVSNTREKLRLQRSVIDRARNEQLAYRYGLSYINLQAEGDQGLLVPILKNAISAIGKCDYDQATSLIKNAREKQPGWSEIYRIEAMLLDQRQESVFMVEEAYEAAIQSGCDDIVYWHYAVFLQRSEENERSIEMLNLARKYPDCDDTAIDNLKALNLMRLGRLDESLELMQLTWENWKNLPPRIRTRNATTYIDLHKRFIERAKLNNDNSMVIKHLDGGTFIAEQVMQSERPDKKLTEKIFELICEPNIFTGGGDKLGPDQIDAEVVDRIRRFAQVPFFNEFILKLSTFWKIWPLLTPEYTKGLFPVIYDQMESIDDSESVNASDLEYTGTIKSLRILDGFGFIQLGTGEEFFLVRSSLLSLRDWGLLEPGVRVKFDTKKIDTEKARPGQLPVAKNLIISH